MKVLWEKKIREEYGEKGDSRVEIGEGEGGMVVMGVDEEGNEDWIGWGVCEMRWGKERMGVRREMGEREEGKKKKLVVK